MAWRDGIITRAVLYDIAQLKGVPWLEPGTPVTRADLEAWEKKSGVKVGPGDVPLLYIGRWKRRAAQGPWTGQVAGYYADTIPWIKQRGSRSSGTTSTSTGLRVRAGGGLPPIPSIRRC